MSALRSSDRLRGKGQSNETKETDSAPAQAASSRRTRKRDADGEPQRTAAAAEDATLTAAVSASASSVPDSKRPRKSSRVRSSAAASSEQKQEEAEEATGGDGATGPHAGAERDEDSAAENEGHPDASDESDADAAMADASVSPLDSLRVATAGHMFSAATLAGRPALPLLAAARVCDFLTAADIVLRIAPTARASYATAVEYARMVAQSAASASQAAMNAKQLGASAVAEPSATVSATAVGQRSDVIICASLRDLRTLLTSPLRTVVAGIHTRRGQKNEKGFLIDAKLINEIATKLPSLTSFSCRLSSSTTQPAFDFPRDLKSLDLTLIFKAVTGSSHTAAASKQSKSWNRAQCDEYAQWILTKVANLPQLKELTLDSTVSPRARGRANSNATQPRLSWLQPLFAGRSRDHLEDLSGTVVDDLLSEMLSEPNRFKRLKHLPLEKLQLTPALLQSLKTVPSLTDIWPDSFADVDDISFIHEFSELRRIGIFEQGPPPEPAYWSSQHSRRPHTAGATAPTALHIVETIESLSFARRAKIESIGVGSDSWTSELLQRLLPALPTLTRLEVHSKAITSLAVLSSVASLRSSLKVLRLQTPSVPRDDVTHLRSLLQLESLSIEGSFSEPLFAKQLFPFLPPYPKQPLHWLRSFVPRSGDEPVPTPPVDPAAKAAADAAFGARVVAHEVSPAESLYPEQLSDVLEYLDMQDFSRAARACRAWRMAASLPTAWTHSATGAADDANATPMPATRSSLGGGVKSGFLSWWPGHDASSELFCGRGRVLSISEGQQECNVLSHSALWRHATAVVLSRAKYQPGLFTASERKRAHQESVLALSQLPRLEALSVPFDDPAVFVEEANDEVPASTLFSKLAHLRRLESWNLPKSAFASLGSLVELSVTGSHIRAGSLVGHELGALHRMQRLVMINYVPTSELAEVIRVLSRDHALRELDIGAFGASRAEFFRTLAGQSISPALSNDAMDTEQKGADQGRGLESGLPALLTRLRISWGYPLQAQPFPLISVMQLPLLRHFELRLENETIDLGELEVCVNSGVRLPPIETLVISAARFRSLDSIGLLRELRELRCIDSTPRSGYARRAAASVKEDFNSRWASPLLSRQRLEILTLEGVQIDPIDVVSLDQLPKLRALTLNNQKSLRVSDLTVLPRIRGLTELQLIDNPQLMLQKRDWLRGIGRQLPGESAVAVAETVVDAAAQSMQDEEENKADTEAEQTPAAAAAVASSYTPGLPADADGLLPLLLQCRSLRVLHWGPSYSSLHRSKQYTDEHSWVQPSSRVRWSPELAQHRMNKEQARQRQALRSLIAAHPQLFVEYCSSRPIPEYYEYGSPRPPFRRHVVVLPPTAGSPAEVETKAAAEAARKLKPDTLYEHALANNPLLLAYEDRALLAIEAQEEQEWRADAERKSELAKQKEQNKKRRKE